MARIVHVASAQMGPIAKSETRKQTVNRLIAMMREAKERGCELVVFTEMALTTFFPRWLITDEAELDGYYEKEMPGQATQPLFDEAKKLGIGFYLGFAELIYEDGRKRRFNTSILVGSNGEIIGTDDEYFNYSNEAVPEQGRWQIYELRLEKSILENIYFNIAAKLFSLAK